MKFEVHPAGEEAVVLSVSYDRTRDCVAAVRALYSQIRQQPHPSIRSLRTALDSLLIEYQPDPSFDVWLDGLLEPGPLPVLVETSTKTITIPVCYHFGRDLAELSSRTGYGTEEIIELHSTREYEVWMMGFMPGFPYLGELASEIQVERKKVPDLIVEAGSVAVAEEYVGIYPFQSPGGWHVIGRTPVRILDYGKEVPWLLDYGMKIRFRPITLEEYESMT